MKKTITIFVATLLFIVIYAADKLRIIQKNTVSAELNVSAIDSITFPGNTYLNIYKTDKTMTSYLISDIDSLKFTGTPDTVKIVYNGNSVSIVNPLENQGVSVSTTNADVVINSALTDNEVRYLVSGSSTDGSLKFYSSFKFELILNGLTLTNTDGPAINNQSTKRTTVTLPAGKSSTLTDGTTYAVSTEDQKGTFFSEGQLIIGGTGSLSVKGSNNHAICSDDYIELEGGSITVTGAVKDGIHAKDHFNLEGGTLNVTATGDAVECETGKIKVEGGTYTATVATADTKGLKCDSTLSVTGGTIHLTVSGNQAKGFKSGGIMNLSGGTITINTSGAAVTTASGSGYIPSYCTAIKCDTIINLSGSNITITATGVGGKGISSDNNINISAGTVKVTNSGNGATYTNSLAVADAYAGSGIEADGNISIADGNITVIASGTAAKGISADGTLVIGSTTTTPVINVSNTGTKLLVSGTANYTTAVYAEPKCLKSDSNMTLNSGTYTISSTQQGAENIDCDAALTINGGNYTLTHSGAQSKAIKSTGIMTLSGGTIGITSSGGVTLQNVAAATYDPSYCTAIKATGVMNLTGSNITITHTGTGSKGISGDANVNITAGTIKITTSGAGATYKNSTSVTDSYSAACITTDANLSITGGNVTCSSSGSGGKGISTTGTVTIGDATGAPTVNLTTTGAKLFISGSGQNAQYAEAKAIKSDGAIAINNGTITIASADDGMKSETSVTINIATVLITTSIEGIEAPYITVNSGNVNVKASDDCYNATFGNGGENDDGSLLSFNGGYIVANTTGGDGLDSNGDMAISGGTIIVHGPPSAPEVGMDYNGTCNVSGGFLVISGTNSNMTQAPSPTSTQYALKVKSNTSMSSSTLFHIQDAAANNVVTFQPLRAYYSIVFSSSDLQNGSTYSIYTGGSSTGTNTNGLYSGGVYSGGTLKKTFTISSIITNVTF